MATLHFLILELLEFLENFLYKNIFIEILLDFLEKFKTIIVEKII